MTRKDYIKLAAILSDARHHDCNMWIPGSTIRTVLHDLVGTIENSLIDILAADNPNFDETRFREAAK